MKQIIPTVLLLLLAATSYAQDDVPSVQPEVLLEIQSLKQDLATVNGQITTLNEGLKETNGSLEKGLEELKRVSDKVDAMSSAAGLDAIKDDFKKLEDDFGGIKSDLSQLSTTVSVLDARFAEPVFSGTASFLRDEQNLYKTEDLKLVDPKSLKLFQNTLSPRDFQCEISFFVDDEKYNKSIENELPALNKAVSLKVHIPAHLLQKFPTTIPLTWGDPTHTKATFTLGLPFDNMIGFVEKAELTLQNLSSRGSGGKIDLALRHKTSKNKALVNLSFNAPVDQNPAVVGVQY